MLIHLGWDIIAILLSLGMNYSFRRHYQLTRPNGIKNSVYYHYYLSALILGLVVGSLSVGSINLYLAGKSGLAKSMLGGIAGAIIAAELFKMFNKISQSTGFYFVPGLLVLMSVGRLGCFFAGLDDFTYGIPTSLSWGVDFGDGIKRHPVQLYESLVLFSFLLMVLNTYATYARQWQQYGFYIFIAFYAVERFLLEFLKPYPVVFAKLNVFQWLALGLLAYAIYMLLKLLRPRFIRSPI